MKTTHIQLRSQRPKSRLVVKGLSFWTTDLDTALAIADRANTTQTVSDPISTSKVIREAVRAGLPLIKPGLVEKRLNSKDALSRICIHMDPDDMHAASSIAEALSQQGLSDKPIRASLVLRLALEAGIGLVKKTIQRK